MITIHTYNELNDYIDQNGVINVSVEIRGLHITKLLGVKKITNNFILGDTEFEDLGDLEIVGGYFTIWNIKNNLKFNSFKNLKVVRGDLNLRYTKLNSLGSLNYIGGNLNLRDTEISDLSSISKVGGNIHLSKKFKSIIDLSHIEIGGKVKYWSENKSLKPIPSIIKGLINSEIDIPHWKFQYIISYHQIRSEVYNIQEFYEYFKKSFLKGIYIDVRGETNYLFTLLIELRDTLTNEDDYQIKKKYFRILSDHYPVLKPHSTHWISQLVEENNEYDYLKELILFEFEEYSYSFCFVRYFYLLNRTDDDIIKSDLIWRILSNSSLTKFGVDNLYDIKKFFEKRVSFSNNSVIISEFRNVIKKWSSYHSILIDQDIEKEIKKVISFYERELRESENDLRISRDLPKIGEGWISETELYYFIRNEFSNISVIHHGKPKWLGRQHLDIYIEDYNIGIEYQGKQHIQSVDYFGGEKSFKKQRLLDERKRILCKQNNCVLIEVFPDYNFEVILKKIKSLIN